VVVVQVWRQKLLVVVLVWLVRLLLVVVVVVVVVMAVWSRLEEKIKLIY
jgi:hypothetical protein